MQRFINLISDVMSELEVHNEDVQQDISLIIFKNKPLFDEQEDDFIKTEIKKYVIDYCLNTANTKLEEFNNTITNQQSYEFADKIDAYFTKDCVLRACKKLSKVKRFIIYHSFGIDNCKKLSEKQMANILNVSIKFITAARQSAISELGNILRESGF